MPDGCQPDQSPLIPFSDVELFAVGPQRTYRGQHLREIAFPLGGIGAGSISLSGNGQLVDWEIFNRADKGFRPLYTFFCLFAQEHDREPVFRVLEGRLSPPFQGPNPGAPVGMFGAGLVPGFGDGFLRMENCSFTGYFPFCKLDFSDSRVPVHVSTEAWSPFVPLDEDDSSLPVAVFNVTFTNTSQRPVKSSVALGLQNIIGYPETGGNVNEWRETQDWRGIVMSTRKHAADAPRFGTMALLTPDDDVTWQLAFPHESWFQRTEALLDGFGATGEFTGPRDTQEGDRPVAQLGLNVELVPGESAARTFVLAWLMPNFEKYWDEPGRGSVWHSWQGNRWDDAVDVGQYLIKNRMELEGRTRRFADALFSSTIPNYVLDAVSSQMSILRSPTVTRLSDGTMYGFEGCFSHGGCCEGTCTHVWSYAQTIAHIFPRLERGMRDIDFRVNLREEDGHMQFRMPLPLGTPADHKFHAAVDGQMGNVLRTYREWQLGAGDGWLAELWPRVKKALEYAWLAWDADRDGLLEGVHHNTLDIEFHGPNTMCGSMYLAALRAAKEMALHLGDTQAAEEYRRVSESGTDLSEETLFNGEYYHQLITNSEAPYQFGPGCMADQLLGQWHAWQYGLGYLYDPARVRSALKSVFRHNFRNDFYDHHNPHRVYALNDERGLLMCTWPYGGRPEVPPTYSFECWTGVESQVGSHLIQEGLVREGLTICKAVRDRHDGYRRNPWNEFECGSHYARAMSNYAYLLALAGLRYSAPRKALHIEPRVFDADFRCFFAADGAWGMVRHRRCQNGTTAEVEVIEGELALESIVVSGTAIPTTIGRVAAGETCRVTVP